MTDSVDPNRTRRRPDGPPPGVVAAIALAFTVASVVAYGTGPTFWTGFLAFAASVPLGIFAATVYARQLRLGVRVPGPGISFYGGITASILLALSGLLAWAATQVTGLPSPVSSLVTKVVFVLGSTGFATGLGLLIAGIAIPALILRLVPRWLAWAGIVLGWLGEVSFGAMLWDGLDAVLPAVRFGGLAWLVAVGFLLPRDRRDVPPRAPGVIRPASS